MMRNKIWAIVLLVMLGVQLASCTAWADELKKSTQIVDATKLYSYEIMTRDIKELANSYPGLISYQSVGATPYGREIWAVKLGNGQVPVMLTGSIHAREWISTVLLMQVIETYARTYTNGVPFEGYSLKDILDKTCIWFLPMANPDGVTLQQFGLTSFPKEDQRQLIDMNDGKTDFKKWKANAQGIDLNQQFPADWEHKDTNVYKPYYWNYKGVKPLEIPEAQVLAEFAKQLQPEIVINYHSSGNVIYWHSSYTSDQNLQETRRLATQVSAITQYGLLPPSTMPGAAGYQDYFLMHFNRPALTIELSESVGETNVPLKNYPDIWQRNKKIAAFIALEGFKLGEHRNIILQEIDYQESFVRQGGVASRSLTRLRELYNKVGEKDVKIFVNGEKLQPLVSPILKNGSLLAPVRAITEYLGANVQWDGSLNLVTVIKEGIIVEFRINEAVALVNGQEFKLNEPASMDKGNLLIPLRFLSEVFQLQVQWVPAAQMVLVD